MSAKFFAYLQKFCDFASGLANYRVTTAVKWLPTYLYHVYIEMATFLVLVSFASRSLTSVAKGATRMHICHCLKRNCLFIWGSSWSTEKGTDLLISKVFLLCFYRLDAIQMKRLLCLLWILCANCQRSSWKRESLQTSVSRKTSFDRLNTSWRKIGECHCTVI